jgi:hypothetical protein
MVTSELKLLGSVVLDAPTQLNVYVAGAQGTDASGLPGRGVRGVLGYSLDRPLHGGAAGQHHREPRTGAAAGFLHRGGAVGGVTGAP